MLPSGVFYFLNFWMSGQWQIITNKKARDQVGRKKSNRSQKFVQKTLDADMGNDLNTLVYDFPGLLFLHNFLGGFLKSYEIWTVN